MPSCMVQVPLYRAGSLIPWTPTLPPVALLQVALPLFLLVQDEGRLRATFTQWAQQHGRSYAAGEQEARFAQYRRGLEAIVRINQRAGGSFWAAPNAFTDLTFEEFAASNLGAVVPPGVSPETPAPKQQRGRKLLDSTAAPPPPPKYVNWVEKGKVTPVKAQGGVSAMACRQLRLAEI